MEEQGGWFERLGEALGRALAWVVHALSSVIGLIREAFDAFLAGLERGAGMQDAGWLAWAVLLLGVLALLTAVGAILRRAWIGAVVRGVIGVVLIAWALAA